MSNDAVELSDEDFLVEDYESEEEGNLGGGKSKRKVAGVSLSSSSEEDEEDGSGDDEYEEDEKLQVYFCSRTHSQLSQFIKELKKTVFANEMKVVCLGSRRNFCINEGMEHIIELLDFNLNGVYLLLGHGFRCIETWKLNSH